MHLVPLYPLDFSKNRGYARDGDCASEFYTLCPRLLSLPVLRLFNSHTGIGKYHHAEVPQEHCADAFELPSLQSHSLSQNELAVTLTIEESLCHLTM